jgi:hypothetical protein
MVTVRAAVYQFAPTMRQHTQTCHMAPPCCAYEKTAR